MIGIFSQVLSLTVIFSPWLLLAIFLIALVAELGLAIPHLMETVWLFSGYNFVFGNISIEHLILFCTVVLIARLAGSSVLFYISWYGKTSLAEACLRYFKPGLARMVSKFRVLQRLLSKLSLAACWVASRNSQSFGMANDLKGVSLFGKSFNLSPITVAIGRFLWLRLPITIALGAKRQGGPLFLGVVIFSVIYDGAYIAFGVLGGEGGLGPLQMLLYPLGIMVIIWAAVFGLRRLRNIFPSVNS